MENNDFRHLLHFLKTRYPNELPKDRIDDFELGKLIGQQEVISAIKFKLNISDEKSESNQI